MLKLNLNHKQRKFYMDIQYLNFSIGVRWCQHSVPSYFTIPAVGSQNVTNKSFLVCVKSKKYAFRVTLRFTGSMR